jgi:hypothetical protein
MNAHDRCLALVATAIDFELDANERRLVDHHLGSCRTCPPIAQALAGDAMTIAVLPLAERSTYAPERLVRRDAVRPAGFSALRLVAVAALLSLLALGAVTAGAELLRRLEQPARLTAEERSPSPSNGTPSSPPCVGAPSVGDLVGNGGGWALGCLGSRDLELIGWVPSGHGANVCEGWTPQWLSCPSGSFIAERAGPNARVLTYAHDGEVPIQRPSAEPEAANGPISGHFARFTGHYGDLAASECRALTASAPLFDDRATLQRQCRETFVVTGVELLTGADVPRPEVAGTWKLTAAGIDFAAPPTTILRSIVEHHGTRFVVGFDEASARTFLWSSVGGGRGWEPVVTDGFAPIRLASDGTRLFGTGNSDAVDVRISLDGRTWTPVPGIPPIADVATVASTSRGVFAAGSVEGNAAIWRFDKDFWNPLPLRDAAGITGGQDSEAARILGITDLGGLVSAFGQGPSPAGFGLPVARIWESKDGVNWSAANLSDSAAAVAAAGLSRADDGFAAVAVGSRLDPIGPASWTSSGGGGWASATFPDAGAAPTESLLDVVEFQGTVVAIGLAPTLGGQLQVVLWGSSDGLSWSPLGAGEMAGGYVTDALAASDGHVLAVGRREAGGAASEGPAIWELVPNS